MRIPVGEFRPDIAELDSTVSAVALNVLPGPNSYRPLKQAVAYSAAMEAGAEVCGTFVAEDGEGNYFIIGGSRDKLWLLQGTAWIEVGSGFNATPDERWSFAQWGTKVLACNLNDDLQALDLSDASPAFTTVSGSPPRARFVDVVSDFVVLAGLASNPQAIAWSGINDEESWTPGTDLSDVQEFPDGGRVMNISGAAALVLQEHKVRQMIRAPGSPTGAFAFQELANAKGVIAPFSVIKVGTAVAYLAEDGFTVVDGAGSIALIGKDRVDEYFQNNADQGRLYSVIGAADPTGPRFLWAFRTGAQDYYDAILVCDWKLLRWSELDEDAYPDLGGLYDLAGLATAALTVDDIGSLYATLEDVPYDFDSRIWQGGRPVLAAIGDAGVTGFFQGGNAAAIVESGERELVAGRRALATSSRPLVDTTDVTVQAGTRARLADTRTWGGASTMTASGRCPLRAGGRYHRFRIAIAAGAAWTHVQGIEVDAMPQGIR